LEKKSFIQSPKSGSKKKDRKFSPPAEWSIMTITVIDGVLVQKPSNAIPGRKTFD
jgi:hypothetical protein